MFAAILWVLACAGMMISGFLMASLTLLFIGIA